MRLGRIPWINAAPVNAAMDRGVVPAPDTVVSATAAELNDLLAAGELDVSVVSAVEYARNAGAYHLLPGSGHLLRRPGAFGGALLAPPLEELDGATVLRTASSRTSVLLLELLCTHVWGISPRFATARAEPGDLASLEALPHDAVLVIGDAALHLRASHRYPVFADLGTAWRDWTGLPFVFAVWAARRDTDRGEALALHRQLLTAREWGIAHLDLLADEAAARTGIPRSTVRAYLGNLDYDLSDRHLAGLTDFFRRLERDGLVPGGSLTFLTAA